MKTIVCDDGSTATKLAFLGDDGSVISATCSNSATAGRVLAFGDEKPTVETNGKTFTFCDKLPSRLPTHSRDYQTSDHARAAIWAAIGKAGLNAGDLRCVATLPLSAFYSGNGKNKALIDAKKKSLLTPVILEGVKHQFKDVSIYPEGLPVAFEYLVNGDNDESDAKTLIIDIGGTTTDIGLIFGRADHIETVKSINTVSGAVISNQLKARLAAEYSEIQDAAVENLIINGASKSLGIKASDFGLNEIIDDIGAKLLAELIDICGDPKTVSAVILVGGPSPFFVETIKARFKNVINPAHSQTKLAESIMAIEKRKGAE